MTSTSSLNGPTITLEPLISFNAPPPPPPTTTATTTTTSSSSSYNNNLYQEDKYSNYDVPIPDELFNYSTLRTNKCILIDNNDTFDNDGGNSNSSTKLYGHQRVFDQIIHQVYEDLNNNNKDVNNNNQSPSISSSSSSSSSTSSNMDKIFDEICGPLSDRIDFLSEIQTQYKSYVQSQQQQQLSLDPSSSSSQQQFQFQQSQPTLIMPELTSSLTTSQQPNQQQQQQMNVYSMDICPPVDGINFQDSNNNSIDGNVDSSMYRDDGTSDNGNENKAGLPEMKYRISRKMKAMEDSSKSFHLFSKKAEQMVVKGNSCIFECERLKKHCAVEAFTSEDKSLFSDNHKVCLISPKVRSKYPKYLLNFTQKDVSEQQQNSLSPPSNDKNESGSMMTVSGSKRCALFKLNVCESYLASSVFASLKKEADDMKKFGHDYYRAANGLFHSKFVASSQSSSFDIPDPTGAKTSSSSSSNSICDEIHLSSMSSPSELIVVSEQQNSFLNDNFYTLSERSDLLKVYAESLSSRHEKTNPLAPIKPLPMCVTLSMVMGHREAIKKVVTIVERVISSFPGASMHLGKTLSDWVYGDLLTEFIVFAPSRIVRCYVKNSTSVMVAGDEYGFTFFPRVLQEILCSK